MHATQRMAFSRLHRATRELRKLEQAPAMPASCAMLAHRLIAQIEKDLALLHDSIDPPKPAELPRSLAAKDIF